MNNEFLNCMLEVSNLLNGIGEVKTLDFTKKEDVEKLDNAIDVLENNEFLSSLFGEDLFKELHDKAHETYENAHKEEKKLPVQPQLQVSNEIKKNIANLACEYMNTMILPNANLKENQVKDIFNGLVDFGCWIYMKK